MDENIQLPIPYQIRDSDGIKRANSFLVDVPGADGGVPRYAVARVSEGGETRRFCVSTVACICLICEIHNYLGVSEVVINK